MPLCESCHYAPWESSNPVTEQDFLEGLEGIGISPTGDGIREVCVGSPFRVPLPFIVKLCCLDKQICDRQEIKLSSMNSTKESDQAINKARRVAYQEAGLPAISDGS